MKCRSLDNLHGRAGHKTLRRCNTHALSPDCQSLAELSLRSAREDLEGVGIEKLFQPLLWELWGGCSEYPAAPLAHQLAYLALCQTVLALDHAQRLRHVLQCASPAIAREARRLSRGHALQQQRLAFGVDLSISRCVCCKFAQRRLFLLLHIVIELHLE